MSTTTHRHIYDSKGNQVCCSQEEKIHAQAKVTKHPDEHDHSHEQSDSENSGKFRKLVKYAYPAASACLLLIGILFGPRIFLGSEIKKLIWYSVAYLFVGGPVIIESFRALRSRSFFNEFTLMTVATLGAFAIGEYPEAVAVMLFYSIGEIFQTIAVNKARNSIKSLLDLRPKSASVIRDGNMTEVDPSTVAVNETLEVKNGESVALDGTLLSELAVMNTAALTGESAARKFKIGEKVLAGMINTGKVIQLKVVALFKDSSIAKILDLVENASTKKAKTELLIRKFAKIYTPIVFFCAITIVIVPSLLIDDYKFQDWLYRGLVFLVISCPCALVISIPLGYFGGIGAASRNGILFKGSNYLDLLTKVTDVVMDKTGTLTTGVFSVQEVNSVGIDKDKFLSIVSSIEKSSTHPIATAIVEYASGRSSENLTDIEEVPGHGLRGLVAGSEVLVGNAKLLKKFNIPYPDLDSVYGSIVIVAIGGKYAGYISVADTIKEDALATIKRLHELKIKTLMLSGDKAAVTKKVAEILKVGEYFGDLLPQGKVEKVEGLKKDKSKVIVFVGDGINDAPVLALSDIGVAMGAMGSDAAIETADVVIQTDHPSKLVTAIEIARATRTIVVQNISISFTVKVIVLILGAGGLATMWEAVFADVGVALVAILNAMRIQKRTF